MNNILTTTSEALENFNAFNKRAILIKIVYLLFTVLVSTKFSPLPIIIFITILLMIIYSLIFSFLVNRYLINAELIINTLFFLALLDIFLITVIINFLGILLYVLYSFYIVLSFMVLPNYKAFYVIAWLVVLYSGLVFFQYFQILKPMQLFAGQKITPQNFNFVFPASMLYLTTLLFLSVGCYDFYRIITKRISALQKTSLALEDEKKLLEEKVQTRKTELENEKLGLERRIRDRGEDLVKESKELEERIIELEGFRKVTIGREEKIKELRERFEILSKKR